MKKGFTMIELIFVIVILGILAAVAIPRLAGTRADAEITAAIANIRTLLSDVGTYYVAKGSFETDSRTLPWSTFTNVPLYLKNGSKVDQTSNSIDDMNGNPWETPNESKGYLKVGGTVECIGVSIVPQSNMSPTQQPYPALIKFKVTGGTSSSLCNAVRNAESVKTFTENKFNFKRTDGNTGDSIPNAIGIGPSAAVYDIFSGTDAATETN